jgi:hypothetical protein
MMADIVSWPGRSGTKYKTELFPIGTVFNAVSGIYILCRAGATPGSWAQLYVGEAQSLYDRLNANVAAHEGFKRATRRGATHIAVMLTYSDAERLRFETDLRHGLNPPCNAQGVPGTISG